MRRFLALVWALMAMNALWLGLAFWARQAPPIRDVSVTTRQDGIVVYGMNRFGLMRIELFQNWPDAMAYLKTQGLELQPISFAERGLASGIKTEMLGNRWLPHGYKVKWVALDGMPGVIFTPDEASARVFANYLKFQGIRPGYLGFSVNVGD